MPRRYFDDADLAAVQAAADEAEARSGGEIVPYIVGRCDDYGAALWTGAAIGALAAAGLAAVLHRFGGHWGPTALWIGLPPLAGAALGYVAVALFPPLARALTPTDVLDLRARRRAEAAFLEEEVFATRDRTGILIFLALFEHRAVILGDSGINARVQQAEWQAIVDELVAGIRAGQPADALVTAIRRGGALLEERGVELRADDVDELPDEPRLRGR
jgi:putative membrane protein